MYSSFFRSFLFTCIVCVYGIILLVYYIQTPRKIYFHIHRNVEFVDDSICITNRKCKIFLTLSNLCRFMVSWLLIYCRWRLNCLHITIIFSCFCYIFIFILSKNNFFIIRTYIWCAFFARIYVCTFAPMYTLSNQKIRTHSSDDISGALE